MKVPFPNILLFGLALLLCGSFISRKGNIAYEELWSGKNSKIDEEKTVRIDSPSKLKSELKNAEVPVSMTGEPPEIDFKKYSVFACYAGSQTNGLELDSVSVNGQELDIYMSRISLGAKCKGARLLVTPFVFVKVERGSWKTYKIISHIESRDCD